MCIIGFSLFMRKLFLEAKAEDLAFQINMDFCCFQENQVSIIVHFT